MTGSDFELEEYRMTRTVFYADFRLNKTILSNESAKYHYVKSLGKAGTMYSVEVFGFCVLDDRIRVIVGGKEVRPRTVHRMMTSALEQYEREAELWDDWNRVPPDIVVRANILKIENAREAMEVLRYIHLTPLSEGYTILAQEYWWTSYSSYRNHDYWDLVTTAPVIRLLSTKYEKPLLELADYHRRGEALHNPVPECIRKGEYGIVPHDDTSIA